MSFSAFSNQQQTEKLMVTLNRDLGSVYHYTFELSGFNRQESNRLKQRLTSGLKLESLFSIYTLFENDTTEDLPALLGNYKLEEDLIRFIPTFPLSEGLCYKAEMDLSQLAVLDIDKSRLQSNDKSFCLETKKHSPTRVTAIYPSSDKLPENLLRFYIYFSGAMSGIDVMENISLVDDKDNRVAGVFFDNYYDLWSPDMRRLTVLFDPGRVKKGLRAHNRMGRALIPGNKYKLVINKNLKDGYGNPLGDNYVKKFEVIEEYIDPPNIAEWALDIPAGRSTEPVVVHFPKPLDHALLNSFIQLVNESGIHVKGSIELENRETTWKFYPLERWQSGAYSLKINKRLEDIAGNNLYGVFDRPSTIQEELTDKENIESIQIIIK